MSSLPLAGVRVVDFSWILNGPQTSLWFGSLGAEVIKVESMVYPDVTRLLPTAAPADGVPGLERMGGNHWLNYSKKSIALNLGTAEGIEIAHRLIEEADIVVEAYKGADIEKFRLGWEDVHRTNPRAVMLSISLLGRTGPTKDWVGWGMMAGGFIGLNHASGWPGGRPRQLGGTWPDYSVAGLLAFVTLAALRDARATGEGQWIDAGMAEAVASTMPERFADYSMNGRDRGPVGNGDESMAPHGTYPCAGDDQWISVAVENDAQWAGLVATLGRPSWASDGRFADQLSRWRNRESLDELLSEATRSHDKYELFHALQAAGVPSAPVVDGFDWAREPHLQARGYLWEMDHPEVGKRTMPGIPARFSDIGPLNYFPAPMLGEHTVEVARDLLGLSPAEIDRLVADKVFF